MNNENLFEAISEIDENLVVDAEEFTSDRKKRNIIPYIASVAAVFVIVAVTGFALKSHGDFSSVIVPNTTEKQYSEAEGNVSNDISTQPTESTTVEVPSDSATAPIPEITTDADDDPVLPLTPVKLSTVSYPSRVQFPVLDFSDEELEFTDEYKSNLNAHGEQKRELNNLAVELYGIKDYSKSILTEFLTGKSGENKVVSPLNIYMALCMLAEASDGNTRQQILSLLGVTSLNQLRQQANLIWQKNYRSDGVSKSVLSNSVWLNSDAEYNQDTVNNIARYYFADTYSGTMGTEEYNSLLNRWLKDNTDGLLDPSEEMNYGDVLMLASALTYKSKWLEGFAEATESGLFNSPSGSKNVDYMLKSSALRYYWGEGFCAVAQELEIGGKIWFILPDEGMSADDIFLDEEVLRLISLSQTEQNNYKNSELVTVNMKVPEFDVSGDTDIVEGLKNLGVSDISDSSRADFSPLCSNSDGIFVSKGRHCVRVVADTEGISAAAYTVLGIAGSARPPEEEVDFILNRPFAFAVTLDSDTVLFAGVVNNP